MRWAVKSAPPPGGDPLEFVMSDETVDRMGDVIVAAGWDLTNFEHHSPALFNHDRNAVIGHWENVRIAGKKLLGRLVLADEGTSVLVDTIRKLVAQNILRAVSVGFRPIKQEPLDDKADKWWGPFRFLEHELLECSLVAVPANPNALQVARSLGIPLEVARTVFGKPARSDGADPASSSLASPPTPSRTKGATMTTRPIGERVQEAQANINTLRDQIDAIDAAANGSYDDNATAQLADLDNRLQGAMRSLAALQIVERRHAGNLVSMPASTGPRPPGVTAPAIIIPSTSKMPKLTAEPREYLYRAMTAHFIAKVHGRPIDAVLDQHYPGDEPTGAILRAAVAPAATTVATWANELTQVTIVDFLNFLERIAIYPVLANKGWKFTFGRAAQIKVPTRAANPKINGSFVGEGQPIPVRKLGLTTIALAPKKMGVISEFTREMANHSTPAIEAVIRQGMNDDTAEAIDTALIDQTAADAIRPAGIRNGVVVTPATAVGTLTTFEIMVKDIQNLIAPIVANRGGRDLVLIVNPAQALAMSWVVMPGVGFAFPEVEGGNLRNIRIVSSTTVLARTVILVDAADFASVTGDTPEFDVSDVATIHEEDTTPLPIGTPGAPATVAAPVRSLWQTASIGIRMLLDMNWAMRRSGMVSWTENVNW